MTTACWEEDTVKRPTVDAILDSLRSAAEQWEPKHGVFPLTVPNDESEPVTAVPCACQPTKGGDLNGEGDRA